VQNILRKQPRSLGKVKEEKFKGPEAKDFQLPREGGGGALQERTGYLRKETAGVGAQDIRDVWIETMWEKVFSGELQGVEKEERDGSQPEKANPGKKGKDGKGGNGGEIS